MSQPSQTDADEAYRDSVFGGLTGFQVDILAAIPLAEPHDQGDHPHGLALKSELELARGHEVNHGRLYPNVDDLVDRGLVEKSEINQRTNGYALTESGVDTLERVILRAENALAVEEGWE